MRDNTPLRGRRSFGALLTTGLLSAVLSLPAHAEYNPRANPVPGGVIVIELPNSIGEGVPEAYFRGKRVYTMNRAYNKRSDDRWVAWVGLSQNLGAGKHSLDIRQPGGKNRSVYIDVVEPEYNGEKRLASRTPLRTDLTHMQQQTIAQDKQVLNSVIQSWSNAEPDSRPFLHPTNGKILTPFGRRIFYNDQVIYNHNSVDLSGQRVVAPASGRIALIRDMFYQGTHVVLDHGSGLFTQYSHLQAVNFRIREGQWINRGEEIGKIGTTGKQIIFGKSFAAPITTPHLGFSVSLNGVYVNPELFLTPAHAQ